MALPRRSGDDLMAGRWYPVPLESKLFQNIPETSLTRAFAALENCFVSESGAHIRFPGLAEFCAIPDDTGRMYIGGEWRGDMIAVSSNGNFYRIDRDGNVEDRTRTPIAGGSRPIFASTEDEMVVAAGGQIIRFAGDETEVLSEDAPLSTHVAFIDNYLVAIEAGSGRWYHCEVGDYQSWDPLDVFTAGSQPDDANALFVSPFREVLVCGRDSIEQFERLTTGDVPFFRRWAVGEGIFAPYTLLGADNAMFGITRQREFVRITGQTSQSVSDDIGRVLEAIPDEDWRDAWVGGHPWNPLHLLGQKFILLQIPRAETPYGTRGLTFLFDYRQRKWASLYGWSNEVAAPSRWPGWSHWPLWGKVFVGCEGKICELSADTFDNDGIEQRMLGRTAHFSNLGHARVDNVRVRVRRGVGSYEDAPTLLLRCNRNDRGFGRWVKRSMGKAGERDMMVEFGAFGEGYSFQFEYAVTDDCPVEIVSVEVQAVTTGR